jgi:hypothetical protein
MTWRYRLRERFEVFAPELLTVAYAGPWLEIRHCRLAIPAGYAWDGCSPALRLPGGPALPTGLWLGPWDGPLGADGRPVTWRPSLVHDALCQFRGDIQGLSKAATVRLFARMLAEAGAPGWMCRLYPAAVSRLGPQSFGPLPVVTS